VAYDEKVAARIREAFGLAAGVSERKMFGGIAFMVDGHMCVGVIADELMVRVGPGRYAEALAEPHVRPMDFTGRPLAGYVYVAPPGIRTKAALARWIDRGMTFVASLPAKVTRKARPRVPTTRRAR
jgi:TfoX/Sxy family transcriptional regulator of competence genes